MNNINYLIHLLILSLLQIVIVDNIHLGSYFYFNIYILAIFLLPYKLKGVPLLLFGFLLGLLMDFADNTVGIHAAASTFVAYIRPRLLQLTSTREELEDAHGVQGLTDFRWFLKYSFMSTLLFNVVLIFAEAFTFRDILITMIRIILSTFISMLFMLLYYFIGIKRAQK
ncbi:rod shape-determining protein MreD [Butyricimonas paravirosa]|uniref:rod shape-determining protein MreD n=1 Tax=Butyricimonas paravirosa TaxID=1472417 RepID=UPI00210BF369|nr:rod shape-determining protein MreD [Butyricimonas paravirosa]MCQ4874931.1 rod shape-determining protein MreD [Butyricimonas paravirosa]